LGKIPQPRLPNSWTLVELALVLPVLFATAAVLFQLGILFIAYLSLVHEMRDIGRYAAVHPNTVDTGVTPASSATCANAVSGSLFRRACDDLPKANPDASEPESDVHAHGVYGRSDDDALHSVRRRVSPLHTLRTRQRRIGVCRDELRRKL
jgi:TadE-like protein